MAAILDPADDLEAERSLDQLIPPPRSGVQKLLVGTLLLGSAVVFAIAMIGGWVRPHPFDRGRSHLLVIDEERGLVGATASLHNFSSRSVRLVGANLINAPGAEVTMIEILPNTDCYEQEEIISDESGGSVSVAATCPYVFTPPGGGLNLPVMIPSQDQIEIRFWFRPTACEHTDGPWGNVRGTFDFGEGAFPPFGRTGVVDEPIWPGRRHSVGAMYSTGEPTAPFRDGLPTAGPLEVACAAMGMK